MKIYKLNKYLLGISLLCIISSSYSQNIYDYKNTIDYANYLFNSQEYQLAVQEFERALYINHENIDLKIKLIRAYQFIGKDSLALSRLNKYFPEENIAPQLATTEFLNLYLKNNDVKTASNLLNKNENILKPDKVFYQSYIETKNSNWLKANDLLANTNSNSTYNLKLKPVVEDAVSLKYKKPIISAGMSSIIPGSGKAYCGYWKNGLSAFLFTSISLWQSYRGFDKKGINSFYGWFFGGMGASFYIGNIYGSIKAANKKNNEIIKPYKNKVEKIYSDYYLK